MFLIGCVYGDQEPIIVEEELVIHEDVDETLANDTIKVLNILTEKLNKNNKLEFNEVDAETLNEYINTYAPKRAYKGTPKLYERVDPPFTTDDYQVYINTETMVLSYGPKALVDEDGNYTNGTSNFSRFKEQILDVIENGFDSE